MRTTDVFSGWTEAVPLLAREQSLIVEGLLVLARQFPIPIRGINSDNDSAFINDTLIAYCREQMWLPYSEADHVLNIARNILAGETCLEHLELRRKDEGYLNALGAERIPDPTTAA